MTAEPADPRHPVQGPAEGAGRGLAGRLRPAAAARRRRARLCGRLGRPRRSRGAAGVGLRDRRALCTPARSTSASPARTCCARLADDLDGRVMLLQALGFGRADLVVAAPKSWIDVETMADVDEVAHLFLARTGRRLRVATKYLTQTRAFFAAPRHRRLPHRRVRRRHRGRAGRRRRRADRRHHHHRRDAGGQRAEGAGRRPDPVQPGAARRQPDAPTGTPRGWAPRGACCGSSRPGRGPGAPRR